MSGTPRYKKGFANAHCARGLLVEVHLSCHGGLRDIPPDVQAELRRLYPGDKATGYQVADLRGAVSVKLPLRAGQ